MPQVKFTEDEMKQVREVQTKYVDIQTELGQLSIAKLRLRNQMDSIDASETELVNMFQQLQADEKKFVDGVREKYGPGSLDPKTGEYSVDEATTPEKASK